MSSSSAVTIVVVLALCACLPCSSANYVLAKAWSGSNTCNDAQIAQVAANVGDCVRTFFANTWSQIDDCTPSGTFSLTQFTDSSCTTLVSGVSWPVIANSDTCYDSTAQEFHGLVQSNSVQCFTGSAPSDTVTQTAVAASIVNYVVNGIVGNPSVVTTSTFTAASATGTFTDLGFSGDASLTVIGTSTITPSSSDANCAYLTGLFTQADATCTGTARFFGGGGASYIVIASGASGLNSQAVSLVPLLGILFAVVLSL